MERYKDIQVQKDASGKRYYKQVRYPEIKFDDSDIYVLTAQGDRLDKLAASYYGDQTLYWVIAQANPNVQAGTLFLPVGTQLRIPGNVSIILQDYTLINSL